MNLSFGPSASDSIELMYDWLAKKPERGQDIRILPDRLAQYEGSEFDHTARKEMKQILSEYRGLLANK